MFVIHVTEKFSKDLPTKNGFVDQYRDRLPELPDDVEEIAEATWLVHSVEALSFLIEVGRAFPVNTLDFQVRGSCLLPLK